MNRKNMSDIITQLEKHIADECRAIDREQHFREMLDECSDEVQIGCLTFSPSRIVEELDPVAFRCGVSDYFSSSDFVEVNGETYDSRDAEKAKEEFLSQHQDELSDLEKELAELEADEEHDTTEADSIKAQIETAKAIIEEIESHSF